MGTWLAEIPRLVAILAVFFVPGLVLARITHRHQPLFMQAAIAPAWSAGVATVLTIGYGRAGIGWTLTSALVGFAVVVMIAFGMAFVSRRRSGTYPAVDRRPAPPLWQPALAALLFGLVAALPILTTIPATGIIQGGDSQFHIGLLWEIQQNGDASPLTASSAMFGLDPSPSFYPTAWHALLVLTMGSASEALVTANVILVITPMLWIFSMMAFTWALTGSRAVMWWALAGSALVPMALVRLQLVTTLWPFVVGMAIVPGLLAMMVCELRTLHETGGLCAGGKLSFVPALSLLAGWVIPALGTANMHPSAFLAPVAGVWLCLICFVAVRLWHEWRQPNRDNYRIAAWAGALFFLLASPVLVYTSKYASLLQLHRSPSVSFAGLPTKLVFTLTMYSPGGGLETYAFYLGVFAVSLLAAVTVWRKGGYRNRALVVAWLAQVLLVLACYIPIPIFGRLTSLYYNNPTRGLVGIAVFLVPMVAIAAECWFAWVAKRRAALAARPATIVAVAGAFLILTSVSYPANAQASHEMVYPERGADRFLADAPEIDMIKRARALPPDSLVLGDPAAGASLIQPVAGRHVVWPYPGMHSSKADAFLINNFHDIHHDPQVCATVRRYGITHFYQDLPGWYNSGFTPSMRPGLYGVNTDKGFTLVDSGGRARLFRIDLCNDPNWRFTDPEPGTTPVRPGGPTYH
ncbi:hypothetical protein J2S70_000590 [Trueperella bonasi]|uniref:Uncharacterized protein n=1 Tax=Trueperella bonasi TaxID=312286 RepID=A0ABT9NG45_9ACTO|nr:DUF6541 family protein [Trueperella bonasi]MDP9806008.1 hypothetical protein [Trueperella bonasi]